MSTDINKEVNAKLDVHGNKAQIMEIAKIVKIKIPEENLNKFVDSIFKVLELAGQIDDLTVQELDNSVFFNFKFQSLELQTKDPANEQISFFRPTKDGMICIPNFIQDNN